MVCTMVFFSELRTMILPSISLSSIHSGTVGWYLRV